MQKTPIQRFSLFTPTVQRAPVQPTDPIPTSKKRKRDTFEIQAFKILPDLAPVAENIDTKFVPITSTYEQEQIVVKTDKALEISTSAPLNFIYCRFYSRSMMSVRHKVKVKKDSQVLSF